MSEEVTLPDTLIKTMSPALANKIAAGEVVQRPASALKELVENAVDAGASKIEVRIKAAGSNLLQVIDNGSGMSPSDAVNCFDRHATSKISDFADLAKIFTLGFRGEALASIAAVAQVTLKTRRHADKMGTLIQINATEIVANEPCSTVVGSSIEIKNLFYNVPARRNFLKSRSTEFKHIVDTVQRLALSHPEIGFGLFHDDKEVFKLKDTFGQQILPADRLQKRIINLFGKAWKDNLLPIQQDSDSVQLWGFVGTPERAKRSKGEQFLFVNDRFFKAHYFDHAVGRAFDQRLDKGYHPFFVLFLKIDPSRVDVNVHPAKTEVKFEDESGIYGFILTAVRKALGSFERIPQLDDPTTDFRPADPSSGDNSTGFRPAKLDFSGATPTSFSPKSSSRLSGGSSRPFTGNSGSSSSHFQSFPTQKRLDLNADGQDLARRLYDVDATLDQNNIVGTEVEKPVFAGAYFQVGRHFILQLSDEAVLLIDQQAAHERILYEQILSGLKTNGSAGQQLLFPYSAQLSVQDLALLLEMQSELKKSGFEFERQDDDSVLVRAVPVSVPAGGESEALPAVLAAMQNLDSDLSANEKLARSLAFRNAVPAGKVLQLAEMQQIASDLMRCESPGISLKGKKTFRRLGEDELVGLLG